MLSHYAVRLASRHSRRLVGAVSTAPRFQSNWALSQQRSHSHQQQLQRQRRPIVNGEAVAFHVNDLPFAPQGLRKPTLRKQPIEAPAAASAVAPTRYESDLVVVLDMDECLIHSQFLLTPSAAQVFAHQQKAYKRSRTSFSMVDSFRIYLPEGEIAHVNVRPGLTEFLASVTSRFETHIFTAAQEVYAAPLLDILDPQQRITGRWYRESCIIDDSHKAYVKDLRNLPLDNHSRVVLVDNNPLSFLTHPENGILVNSFYNDASDTELGMVWDLLQELDQHKDDVRPILTEKFRIAQALQTLARQKKHNNGNNNSNELERQKQVFIPRPEWLRFTTINTTTL